MVGLESGGDQRLDGLGDGVLDAAQGLAELGVLGVVAAVEESEAFSWVTTSSK